MTQFIFKFTEYNDVFGGISKRSTDSQNSRSKINKGIFPQKKSYYKGNLTTDFWRLLPAPAPVYKRDKLALLNKDEFTAPAPVYPGAKVQVRPEFKAGNQTYKVVYSKHKTPQKFQKSPKFKKKFVQNTKR